MAHGLEGADLGCKPKAVWVLQPPFTFTWPPVYLYHWVPKGLSSLSSVRAFLSHSHSLPSNALHWIRKREDKSSNIWKSDYDYLIKLVSSTVVFRVVFLVISYLFNQLQEAKLLRRRKAMFVEMLTLWFTKVIVLTQLSLLPMEKLRQERGSAMSAVTQWHHRVLSLLLWSWRRNFLIFRLSPVFRASIHGSLKLWEHVWVIYYVTNYPKT